MFKHQCHAHSIHPITPKVDVLVVTYNSSRWLEGLFDGLAASDYPMECIRLVVVDNHSKDDTLAELRARSADLPFPVEVLPSPVNGGFTGGYAVAFEHATADYWFVLNPDTRPGAEAIRFLVQALQADPQAGIAEARQSPHEHPKYVDPFSRETSWASGACMMLRREAVAEVGGFDPLFFMYAEDVDLSWRMWLNGWKCLYVSDAVVEHLGVNLDPTRKPCLEHYYNMRNGAMMRVAYGSVAEAVRHYLAMLRAAVFSRQPIWHRWGTIKGLISSLWHLPAALRKRRQLLPRGNHPWVGFNGWEYGRYMIDLAQLPSSVIPPFHSKPVVHFERFKAAASNQRQQSPSLGLAPRAMVDDVPRDAIVTSGTSGFYCTVEGQTDLVLAGFLGHAATNHTGRGTFSVEQDGRQLFRLTVCRTNPEQAGWIPFSVRLRAASIQRPLRLAFSYATGAPRDCGFWADVNLFCIPQVETASGPVCKISLVIPTFNRAKGIVRMVARLLSQNFDPTAYEIVLVDSCSTDHTPKVLEELGRDARVRPFRCNKKGAAAARNLGLDHARGELVVLIDDDILVRRDFLEQLWSAYRQNQECVLLARIVHPFEGRIDPFLRYLEEANEINSYHFPDPSDVPANYFFTGCVAIPRKILGTVRFDEGFQVYGVEDIDFGFELLKPGIRMKFLPQLSVWHDYYPDFDYFRRKMAHAGFSLGYFLNKRPELRKDYIFENKIRKFPRLITWGALLTRPAAMILKEFEKILYRTGPIYPVLYLWYKAVIRVNQYRGFLAFFDQERQQKQTQPILPELGHRESESSRLKKTA